MPLTHKPEWYELQFLREWYEWAVVGAPGSPCFSVHFGLCNSYDQWLDHNYRLLPSDKMVLEKHFYMSLKLIDGMGSAPFGGVNLYISERDQGIIHENPTRLAWVKQRIEYLDATVERESDDG